MLDVKRSQCRGGIAHGHRRRGRAPRPARWSWRRSCRPRSPPTGWCWSTSRSSGRTGGCCTAGGAGALAAPGARRSIPPGEFLPVAQRSGLLRELDRLGAAHGGRRGRRLAGARGPPASAVAVNLAGLLPGDAGLRGRRAPTPSRPAGLPWDRLVLELVETSLVALPAARPGRHGGARRARRAVRRRRLRHRLLLAGAAQGAARADVKVDRAFVTGDRRRTPWTSRSPARSWTWPRRWAASTVAEGVETAEQFHVLRGIGVDAYQGWLFSRPLPPRAGARAARRPAGLETPARRRALSISCVERQGVAEGSQLVLQTLCRLPPGLASAAIRRPARRRR